MAAGSIIIDLLMKTGSFETDTKRAEARLKKMQAEAEKIGKAIGVAFAAGATALAYMTKQAIDSADELSKTAQKIGLTTEKVSGLQYAFELGGVASEEFNGSMVKLSRNISEAARGTKEQADAFNALGVAVTNTDGTLRSSDKVLSDIADKFASYKDGVEKTALAVAIFGRSGANLVPALNAGSAGIAELTDEAEKLGIVIDSKTGKAAEEFNDTLSKIGKLTNSVGLSLAKEMIGPLQAVADELLESSKKGGAFRDVIDGIATSAAETAKVLAVLAANVAFVFKGIGREIGAIAAQVVALGRLDIKGFRAISDAVKEDGERARRELDALERRLMGLGGRGRPANEGGGRYVPGDKPAAPRLAGTSTGGGSRAGRAEFTSAILDPLQEQQQAFLQTEKDYAAVDAALQRMADSARDFSSAILDPVEEQRQAFLQSEKDYEAVDAAIKQLGDSTQRAGGFANDLGLTFSSAFEDAIVNGGKLLDLIRSLEKDIVRLITRKLVTEPLTNAVSGWVQGIAGGGAGASFFSALSGLLPSFDTGTPYVPRDMMAMVHQGERIVPAAQNRSGGGGGITINQNFARGTDMRTVSEAAARTGEAVQRALARNR